MIQLSFNLTTLIISISVIIAITFGCLLFFSQRSNRTANRFLAVMLFIVALWNTSLLISELVIYQYIIGIIWVPFTYTLALGPSLYFYVLNVTKTDLEKQQRLWLHFIPVLVQVLLFLLQVFIAIPQGIGYLQTELFQTFDPIINFLAITSLLLYSLYARHKIHHYHLWVEENYSNHHRYQLHWLKRLLSGFLILMIIWLIYLFVDYFIFDYQLTFKDYYQFHLSLAIISIWLSIEAYSLPDVTFPDVNIKCESKPDLTSSPKDLTEQAQWLEQQIAINHLYLDPELSLKSLADTLAIHPNVTSRLINDGLGKSFTDCINEYRVEAVKEKLTSPESHSLTFLAIAFDCGFNSKTSFNRIFKKHVGMTPQQYRKAKNIDD